ncbi:hypothetical protein FLGE108171_15405 [Flavobacterium gelidilacus]
MYILLFFNVAFAYCVAQWFHTTLLGFVSVVWNYYQAITNIDKTFNKKQTILKKDQAKQLNKTVVV